MPTPAPRPRGGGSMRDRLREDRKDREQIRRQHIVIPKPKPPVVPSGGGIIGMAEVISTSGSVIWGAGQSALAHGSVSYGTIRDPYAGSGGGESKSPISSWLTINGNEITLAPGWYIPVLDMRLVWATGAGPSAFGGPYMNGGWDVAHNDYAQHPSTPSGDGFEGLYQIANFGPTYMSAGTNLHAECRAVGTRPTADNDVDSSAIIWNITKLG